MEVTVPEYAQPRPRNGWLQVDAVGQNLAVMFCPHNDPSEPEREPATPLELVRLDRTNGRIIISPLDTRPWGEFGPKYQQMRSISFPWEFDDASSVIAGDEVEEILRQQPRGLTHDFQFGLGFPRELNSIVATIESQSKCVALELVSNGEDRIDGDTLVLTLDTFEAIRAELARVSSRGSSATLRVKAGVSHNLLSDALGVAPVPTRAGRHPHSRLISAAAEMSMTSVQQQELVEAAIDASRTLVHTSPESIGKLRADLELVGLEELITRFSSALDGRHPESFWQDFFQENPFALHSALGQAVMSVHGQASVGGRKISGSGDKIADFLVKNPATNNVGIVEIKTPGAQLVDARAYRGGVHPPHSDLSGSIVQALDQRYQLQRALPMLKETSRIYDLESYSIACWLIIGRSPTADDEQKSFELIRHNSASVAILTYDELLDRLRQLYVFLSSEA
jgi:hypothetical protein